VAKIELHISSDDVTADGKPIGGIERAAPHIPHNFRIAATVDSGSVAVKGNQVALKHLGGNNYLLTFE